MPARHPKRGRLWLNDGSCIKLRPAYGNHVWAYDFVFERTRDGRPLKFLTALLAVASDGLLRVSEVAALDVGDVKSTLFDVFTFMKDALDQNVATTLRSKTILSGNRQMKN